MNGQCTIEIEEKVPDDFCAEWDWDAKVCLKCSQRAVQSENGRCIKVSDLCRDYSSNGDCASCYKGYELKEGRCEIVNVAVFSMDLGCAKWDWDNLICLQCSFRYYFD